MCREKRQIKKLSLIPLMELKIDIVKAVTNALFIVMGYDRAKKMGLLTVCKCNFQKPPMYCSLGLSLSSL